MFDRYFCLIFSEPFRKLRTWHPSTIRRLRCYGFAIHLPIIMWALIGYCGSLTIFEATPSQATWIAFSGSFIFGVIFKNCQDRF